jgi:ketosteroid isomerase-like protein
MRVTVLVVGIALVLSGCSRNSGPVFDNTDADRIKRLIEDLRTAFNAKDPAKAAALYSTTAAVLPPNRPLMRGRKFVEQYYVDRFAEGATNLELQPADVSGQGTLAYASGDYRLKLMPAQGPARLDRGKFLWIFREQNGQWLIEYVTFSSDFVSPPPA